MTAGICMTTHQQPGSVCNTDVIQKIEQSLGKSSLVPGGAQIAVARYFEAVTRREEIERSLPGAILSVHLCLKRS
jgi:hypothetical protein